MSFGHITVYNLLWWHHFIHHRGPKICIRVVDAYNFVPVDHQLSKCSLFLVWHFLCCGLQNLCTSNIRVFRTIYVLLLYIYQTHTHTHPICKTIFFLSLWSFCSVKNCLMKNPTICVCHVNTLWPKFWKINLSVSKYYWKIFFDENESFNMV